MSTDQKERKIIYKRATVTIPFCSVCESEILGNGSMITPYKCKCGVWEYDTQTMKYEVKLPVVN